MRPQGTTKGEQKGNVWQEEKPYLVFIDFYEVLQGLHFSPPGSRMGSQGAAKGTKKVNVWEVGNPSNLLLNFMKSYQGLTFSTRIQDGIPMDNQRDEKQNVWEVEKP